MRFAVVLAFCFVTTLPAPGLAQPPDAPPVGEERAKMLEGIRASYPNIPDRIAEIMADARRRIGPDSNCELMRFLADPASKAPEGAARSARMFLPMRCGAAPEGLTPEAASAKLGSKDFILEVGPESVTAIARSKAKDVRLCCSVQTGLVRLGDSDLFAAKVLLTELDRGILSVGLMTETGFGEQVHYRGPKAPAKPPTKPGETLAGKVLQRELRSTALGETRKLVIYVPPGWSKDRSWPAVYLADGLAEQYAPMVEAMIEAKAIRPIVLVSAEAGEQGVVGPIPRNYGPDLRSAEYLRGFPDAGDRFERHLKFFAEELPAWARAELGVSRRREDVAVAGYSNGGVLAAWVGLIHPQTFANAVAMSPGWLEVKREDFQKTPRARFFMSGGLYEQGFSESARRTEALLKEAGYQVSGQYLAAGHDPDQWEVVFHDALLEIFSTTPASARPIAATN